jgi:hypothetical protein
MNTTRHVLDDPRTDALKPALASIRAACKYMGDVSRAKFYSDILPKLETVHVGTRHLIVVSSMDRLITKLLEKQCPVGETHQTRPRRAVRTVGQ